MEPVYPSKTFPNHWSIVTGLRPAWSGIIANTFTLRNRSGLFGFTMRTTDPAFWLGEPIWLSAVRAGRPASTNGWPGSEVYLPGWDVAKNAAPFNYSQSPTERVDAVLATLRRKPAFATLYLNDVDDAGHAAGPDSDEVDAALAVVDAALWRLLQGLNASNLLGSTHLLLVSDHGMAPTCGCGRVIPVQALLPPALSNASSIAAMLAVGAQLDGPFLGLPCDACSAAAARALAASMNAAAAASGLGRRFTAFYKKDLPARLGAYGESERVWPVVGLVGLGWVVSMRESSGCGGSHGWDPAYGAVHAIFMGAGPRFTPGLMPSPSQLRGGSNASTVLANVELYGIMAELLGVPAAPHNGTAGYPAQILRPRC